MSNRNTSVSLKYMLCNSQVNCRACFSLMGTRLYFSNEAGEESIVTEQL